MRFVAQNVCSLGGQQRRDCFNVRFCVYSDIRRIKDQAEKKYYALKMIKVKHVNTKIETCPAVTATYTHYKQTRTLMNSKHQHVKLD